MNTSKTRRAGPVVRLCSALTAAAILGGCGISAESDVNKIKPQDVPFDLLLADVTAVPETGIPVQVYLLSGDRLLTVDRTADSADSLADVVRLTVDGPTDEERLLGITSAIPTGTVGLVSTSRGVAEVDLNASFGELRSSDQVLALGQIVYGLTALPGIGAVAFTLEGEPISVPRTDGTASDEPLSRDDFLALKPA